MENLSFEELMERLNKTVNLLEKGELTLEESMKSYEEGINLVKNAESILKSFEKRMEEILADGSIKELNISVS